MADYQAAREAIENMSENLLDLGFNAPFATVHGNNAIGKAVRDCRDQRCAAIVKNYLKGLVVEMKASTHPKRNEGLQELSEAWKDFKGALLEGLNDDRPAQGDIARYQR